MVAVDLTAALGAVMGAFGVAAAYTPPSPPGAAAMAVTALARREDADLVVGGGRRGRTARGVFEILAADLAAPAKGGRLVLAGGEAWVVTDEPEMADPDRKVWTLRCELEA